MTPFRRKTEDVDNVLYVHLASDGGIFVVWGETGREDWIAQAQLQEELDKIGSAEDGLVLYSRDAPLEDPPEIVEGTFQEIVDRKLRVQLVEEAHPHAALPEGATTLMMAAHAGTEDVLSDLISRGAELEARDQSGYTALMYAANAGQPGTVGLLLAAGADANAADNDRSTPIMFAAQHSNTEIVRQLLDAGARVESRGDHGLTALGLARQNGHEETERVLVEAGATD
jgi:hypothetical protein